mgnify:CR=1 FL=1
MKLTARQQEIINIIAKQKRAAISKVQELLSNKVSTPTLNRDMAKLVKIKYLQKIGAGRTTVYIIAPFYKLFSPIKVNDYFNLDVDARDAQTGFNYELLQLLKDIEIFTDNEQKFLANLVNNWHIIDKPNLSNIYSRKSYVFFSFIQTISRL